MRNVKNSSLILAVFLTAGLLAGCSDIRELPTFPGLKVQSTQTPVIATPEPVPTPSSATATEAKIVSAVTVNVPVADMSGKKLDRKGMTAILDRGDTVNVTDLQGNFLMITLQDDPNNNRYLVDSRYVHLNLDETVSESDGYCNTETKVYRTADFSKEPVAELEKNMEIHLIDILGKKAYISWKTITEAAEPELHYGYIEKENYTENMNSSGEWANGGDFWGYWGGSAGSDRGSIDSGGGDASGGGVDGGTIVLSGKPQNHIIIAAPIDYTSDYENTFQTCEGTIFSDETPLYIGVLHRGDAVTVAETDSNYAYILIEDILFTIPVDTLDDGSGYAEWNGYTKPDAVGYQYSDLSDSGDNFETNTMVTVVDENDALYIVRTETGFAYIQKNFVSTEEYQIVSGGWGDSGSWGGGGGGDAGGGGGADWTAPTM